MLFRSRREAAGENFKLQTSNRRETSRSKLQGAGSVLCASGLLFGLSFLMKQHGVFFGIFGGIYLIVCGFITDEHGPTRMNTGLFRTEYRVSGVKGKARRRSFDAVAIIYDVLLFSAGFVLPYALTCLVLWVAGVFPQFWFWTVSYASKYVSQVPLTYGSDAFKLGLNVVLGPDTLFWVLPWAGAVVMWWESRFAETSNFKLQTSRSSRQEAGESREQKAESRKQKGESGKQKVESIPKSVPRIETDEYGGRQNSKLISAPRLFLVLFLICSFASVSVGFAFRPHYFITLLPALSLLTGLAVSRALHLLRRDRTIELFLAVPILAGVGIAVIWSLAGNGAVWFTMTPQMAKRQVYNTTAHEEAANLAGYIKAKSAKNARIAVIGSEPEIYFLSHRRSATAYLYAFPLMENQPYAEKMQVEMIAQIETNKPEYVVYCNDDLSWLATPDSNRHVFDWWKKYWGENLELLETIPIKERHVVSMLEQTPELTQTNNADGSGKCLLLLKRKQTADLR